MAVALDDELTDTFAALAHPVRRAIITRLTLGEADVGELAAPFALTLPAISKHIKVLERAGLIVQETRAQRRPCRLAPERLAAAAGWADEQRLLWEARLDRMDARAKKIRSPEGGKRA